MKYAPVIGMEIHVELKTASKMFCACVNDPFGAAEPNTHTCPVCLGFPGALPVPNRKAVEWTIRLAHALNCEISRESKFDRKHYTYPDLPKGYQISQYDQPIGEHGWLEIGEGDALRKIRIRRVHLEEDTGKLIHEKVAGEDLSLVDFNRSGVPLVEIVTEPDFRDAEEAKEFGKKLQRVVRYVGVSDADMEKGSMRLEANVSLAEGAVSDDNLPAYKVELKNINSFRFMAAAVEYEIKRQAKLLDAGEKIPQETRGWDEGRKETRLQRTKEDAQEYRYFPEPDIPPMRFSEAMIEEARDALPLLPDHYDRIFAEIGLPAASRDLLIDDADTAARVASTLGLVEDQKKFANWFLRHRAELAALAPEALAERFVAENAKEEVGAEALATFVAEALAESPAAVAEYRAGKEKALFYLLGQVQKKARGSADADTVTKLLKEQLQA